MAKPKPMTWSSALLPPTLEQSKPHQVPSWAVVPRGDALGGAPGLEADNGVDLLQDACPIWLTEFAASGISPELALANVEWLEGRGAIARFLADALPEQRQNSHLNADGAALQRRYSNFWDGAWFARSELCPVPYAKPVKSRIDRESGKPIKYETPPKAQSLPLFPVLPGHSWEGFDGPLAITEGLKKALTLGGLGLPTVALRGVTQWARPRMPGDIGRVLYPEIAAAVAGRTVYIAFDQDKKVKTRFNVSNQGVKLARAIAAAGGEVRVLDWDGGKGKGIDDLLMGASECDRVAVLEELKKRSLTLKQYQRRATIARAQSILAAPPPVASVTSEGEYLPTLPALQAGAVQWLDAPMNSGKTYQIGRSWVAPWVASGGVAVVLSPLNSLGMQTAQDWDLPHIHDYKTDGLSRRALEADISSRGGIVACFNSVHRVLSLLPGDRPLLLVIDEAAQVLDGAGEGGTLRGVWAERWEQFITLAQRAADSGAIALAEAGIDWATINLVKQLSGAGAVVGIRHIKEAQPWPVTLHQATPLSSFRAALLESLGSTSLDGGDNVLFVTSSQAEGRRLEKAAIASDIAVVRIDSETNEGGRYRDFFECPEAWLYEAQPQLLILSPSAKTGLSIEGGVSVEGAYFDRVFGYFPSLDTDTHLQLLGRYRPSVPRVIWCPAYIQPGVNEKPNKLAITSDLEIEAANYARAGGFTQSAADSDDGAIAQFLAARRSRRWAQKVRPCGALVDALDAAGHVVDIKRGGDAHDLIIEQWRGIKETLAREDSALYAGIQLKDSHTAKWANEVMAGLDSTYLDRCTAEKVRVSLRFPGLNWDDAPLWYVAQFAPRNPSTAKEGDDPRTSGPLAPGAALWAESYYCSALWAEDTTEARELLTQRLKAIHLLPYNGVRADIAAIFRPLVETLLEAGEVVPGGDVEGQIKALALKYGDQLRRYWRLGVAADQSDTAIANKVARKFGLTLSRSRRIVFGVTATGKPKQEWVYAVTADPVWRALVAARRWAIDNSTNLLNQPISEFVLSPSGNSSHSQGDRDTAPPPPPEQGGGAGDLPLTA